MSANTGPLASTKGESTSTKVTKSGYDHLDINKLYKGKSTEPVTKTVTQKHGMQTLGKAPPARRPGNLTAAKSESTANDVSSSPSVPQTTVSAAVNLGQVQPHPHPGWANTLPHPQGPPSPHNVPGVPTIGPSVHEKNWSGGPERSGNFPSQRFAQEFPTLDSGGDATKGPPANSSGPSLPVSGPQQVVKPHDSQYGPGPILRPQTEGSWIQGGGRNPQRPPGPAPPSNAPAREFGPERVNLGGPTPPPMSLGQGGPVPPPLGAYPMQFRAMVPPPSYMYQGSGPPGPGGFYPAGPGMPPRYGMPIPAGAPPPGTHPSDAQREMGRNRGPPQPARPGSHFTANPIIKQEDLERMNDMGVQDGGWASTHDDVDYNKKINFEDEEEERREGGGYKSSAARNERKEEERERRNVNIKAVERQPSITERERDRDQRFENRTFEHAEKDEDWKRSRNNVPYEGKDRDRGNRRARDDDWRSGNNRFEEDRHKKTVPVSNTRQDVRAAPDFSSKYSNIAPRFLRQQQQGTQPPMAYPQQPQNQRQTTGPVSNNQTGNERENREFRERDWEREPTRDRPPSRDMNFKILERRRVDSETNREVNRDASKRFGNPSEYDSNFRFQEKDQTKNLRFEPAEFQRERSKDSDEARSPNSSASAGKGAESERSEQPGECKDSSRKVEENKVSFRNSKQEFTSWADEVDDEEFNREAEDGLRRASKDNSIPMQPKRDLAKQEERDRAGRGDFAHRRIYIQQRKVEDMRSQKSEPPPEQKQATEPVKQDKPVEKSKPVSVWGDRENQRDRLKQENENQSQQKEKDEPSNEKESNKSSENESISQKSEKPSSHNSNENSNEKIEKKSQENDHRERERRGSRERIERSEQKQFDRQLGKQDSRFERVSTVSDRDRDRNMDRDRDRHDRGGRETISQKSEKASSQNSNENSNEKTEKKSQENDHREKERRESREMIERSEQRQLGKQDSRFERISAVSDRDRDRHDRSGREPISQKSEKQINQNLNENSEKTEKKSQEHDHRERERRESRERIDRSEPKQFDRQLGKPDSRFDRVSTASDRERDRDRLMDRDRDRHDRSVSDNKSLRGGRNRERGGRELGSREQGNREQGSREQGSREQGSREQGNREQGNREQGGGSWGESSSSRPGSRGGRLVKTGRGGNSSSFYDRPSTKRSDSEKERDEKDSVKEERYKDQETTKDNKKTEKTDSLEPNKKEGLPVDNKPKRDKDKETSNDASNKITKSPSTSKRNIRGGSRLQGYGPPSDKIPFSSHASNKDEESYKEKSSEHQSSKSNLSQQIPTSGPIPLMELGEISPPNMPSRSRHNYQQGNRGNRNTVPPRLRDDQYSSYNRGGGGNGKWGRNNDSAKPLMSLNSNELERSEWETESESEEDSKKSGQGGSSKTKKEISKGGVTEKYRQNQSQNQNISRNSAKLSASGGTNADQNNSSNNQDTTNNNSRGGKTGTGVASGRTGSSLVETESFSGVIGIDSHETADNTENIDGDSGGFQEVRNKKNFGAKDKTFPVATKTGRSDKVTKGRPVKNPPYEARPNQSKDIPPRFAKQQPTNTGKATEGNGSFPNKEATATPQGNAWEKPITANLRPEQGSHQSISQSSSATTESKDSLDLKMSNVNSSIPHVAPKPVASLLDGTNPPVKTIVFENTNFKSGGKFTDVSKTTTSSKISDLKKDGGISSTLEIGKDLPLNFGKAPGENSPELDFGSSPFDDPSNSAQATAAQQIPSHVPAKPMSISQSSRSSYVSHQPSPISPLAADLNEKIQSVKRVWDAPSMPSVAEQTSVCGSEENSFHGGFGAETFKGSDSTNRDFTQALQQTSTGYAPGNSPALSAIAKPDSSSSPNASAIRQVSQPGKSQQPSGLESQSHATMSSPFGGYAMPHQGGTTFGGMPAVPSPPTVMYGATQPHLHGGPGVYQTFPHDGPQVLNTNPRPQYSQYSAQAAANSSPYGLAGSLFLTSIDSPYQSLSSYQHQQAPQGGPPGQAPNQNNRISPGPLTTSGGGNAGVIINSTSNSMMGMKSQGSSGNHPNLSHQVHPGAQQGYSQLSHHHHPAAMPHPSHHIGNVGSKGGYSQGGISAQSQPQLFMAFDPNQPSVINLGQNYLSSGIRSGPPGGPPPSATPPVQALQASSSYYSGSSGNQGGVYPSGSTQGGNLQQLHVAVAPTPQALQNLQNASQHYGLQFQPSLNIPGYNSQAAAATVSALNLGNPLVRPGGHSYIKQGLDMVPTTQLKSSHDSMMNQSWNTSAFQLNQNFHGANKTGNISDRSNVNNMNNQRKGNNHMSNMGAMNKYSNPGYPGQQKGGGRFTAPGPIQRPISTSPSTGPGVPSSSHSLPASEST